MHTEFFVPFSSVCCLLLAGWFCSSIRSSLFEQRKSTHSAHSFALFIKVKHSTNWCASIVFALVCLFTTSVCLDAYLARSMGNAKQTEFCILNSSSHIHVYVVVQKWCYALCATVYAIIKFNKIMSTENLAQTDCQLMSAWMSLFVSFSFSNCSEYIRMYAWQSWRRC